MGNAIAKRIILKPTNIYFDMTQGFISKAGGRTSMVCYPPGLLHIPKKCPKCGRGSGLKWMQMASRLEDKRKEYEVEVEAIIKTRAAKGDPDPYMGFTTPGEKNVSTSLNEQNDDPKKLTPVKLVRYLKRNEVAPEDDDACIKVGDDGDNCYDPDRIGVTGDNDEEDDIFSFFPVDPNEFIICKYCIKLEKFKNGGKRQEDLKLARWRIPTRSLEWVDPNKVHQATAKQQVASH